MEGSASSVPTFLSSSLAENNAPEPRRSGRVRTATQRFESIPQTATSTSKSAGKRKRSDTTHDDESGQQPDTKKTHAQPATKNKLKSITKRVANNGTPQSDDANAKPTTNSRLSRQAGSVIDLTEDEEVASSKQSKRSRTGKGEEKRLKSYRKQAPQKYATIAHRATTQRMVVIDRRRTSNHDCPLSTPDCPMEEVDLAGSTGNIYTVKITHIPECTCPDFRINVNPQCKHILYVLLKVLKAPEPLNFQAALLTSELEEIFNLAGPLPTEAVHTEDKDGKRKPIEGDCPICCEELSQEKETIVWCQAACGNNLHKTCFDQWAATKGHGQVTCPYCRTQWQNAIDSSSLKGLAKTARKNQDGYVNVASQVGLPSRRDYSSYHQFWVRGQRRAGLLDDDGDYDYDYDYDD